MAANFPNSPNTNDTFTESGLTFVWNGSAWKLNSSSGTKGEKGQKGEVGVTGATGDKGQKGEVGDKGQKGEIGATGGTGGTGQKGQKGEQGATGSAGSDGSDGDKGQKGELGTTGAGGSTGAKGQKGEVGATGGTGGTGSTGAKGQKGEASTVAGDKGQKGEIGTTGDKGATGSGDKGQKGEEGPQGGGAPVGQIVAWSGSAASLPTGYFLCDGSAVSRTTYAALFTVVGTTHGAGNGSTTFNIPDLRSRFVVGASSSGGYSVGNTGGSADATLVSHSHTINNHTHSFSGTGSNTHSHGIPRGSGGSQASIQNYVPSPRVESTQSPFNTTNTTISVSISGTTGNPSDTGTNTQGSSATNANLPPYYALAYIIQFSQGGETAKGQKGEAGSTGSTGSTGAKGQKGEEGDKGAASSVQGPTGDKGQKGEVGATGAGGSTGSTGAKGQKGEIGATGSTGSTGSAGSDGSDGSKGQKGEVGAQGSTGASGPATVPQIKKAENTSQQYVYSGTGWNTKLSLTLNGVDNDSHVLIVWRGEIFSGSGNNRQASIQLTGGSFAVGSTGGSTSNQSWTGFGDVVIDVGSGTTRTYEIQWKRNNYASYAIVRNCYLFVMEMKPN